MKTSTPFFGLSASPCKLARVEIYTPTKAAIPAKADPKLRVDALTGLWENLAFSLLWAGALAAIGYCFATLWTLG